MCTLYNNNNNNNNGFV